MAVIVGDADPPTARGRLAGDGDVATESHEHTAAGGCAIRLGGHVGGERLGGCTKDPAAAPAGSLMVRLASSSFTTV